MFPWQQMCNGEHLNKIRHKGNFIKLLLIDICQINVKHQTPSKTPLFSNCTILYKMQLFYSFKFKISMLSGDKNFFR